MLGAVLAAFLVAGTVLAVVARNQLVGRIDERIAETAQAIATAGEVLGRDALIESLEELTPVTKRADATLILDASGRNLWILPSGTTKSADPLPDLSTLDVAELRDRANDPFTVEAVHSGLRYRVVTAPLDDGVIVLATPLQDVQETVGYLVLTMVVAAGAVLMVVAGVTTIASRRAIRPIDEMVEMAEAIGEGDLSHRIPAGDIGETQRLGDALNKMLAQLEQAFTAQEESEERLRQFIADASHELRTPLTSIRGYAELYLSDVATDPGSVDKAMRRIRSEAVRTGDMVNDLLLLARLDQHHPIATEPVDLSRIVTESVADLQAVQPDRSIRADIRANVIVHGDADRLRQVVANLLANTRVHAGDAPVVVELAHHDNHAVLSVTDEGPGMDAEQAVHAFDRFWRASESRTRHHAGAGLGLSIAHTVVEAHGGTVAMETTPGEGTTLTVRIPVELTASM